MHIPERMVLPYPTESNLSLICDRIHHCVYGPVSASLRNSFALMNTDDHDVAPTATHLLADVALSNGSLSSMTLPTSSLTDKCLNATLDSTLTPLSPKGSADNYVENSTDTPPLSPTHRPIGTPSTLTLSSPSPMTSAAVLLYGEYIKDPMVVECIVGQVSRKEHK